MTKLTWDKYIDKHKTGICAFTAVNNWKSKTPKNLAPNNKKWPTAYGMLIEILKKCLVGDWAIIQQEKGNVIHLIMSEKKDAQTLGKLLSTGKNNKTPLPTLCTENLKFTYQPENYSKFAQALMYAPKSK